MITPKEFPYITGIHVNDCYTYKNFDIKLHDYKPFSHLILTGQNGSGKTTILRNVDNIISIHSSKNDMVDIRSKFTLHENFVYGFANGNLALEWVKTYLKADRKIIKSDKVSTVVNDTELASRLRTKGSSDVILKLFKQYLVNKKVLQAFDQLNKKFDRQEQTEFFFSEIEEILKRILNLEELTLIFDQDNFELYLFSTVNGRQNFDVLSDGHTSLINIFIELFIRIDLIRGSVRNYSYNPCGIVLIDEPETHLHLELQEQVLPLLTSLFPNIQFIVATHSPAVIASIKNATIFDLTTKETRTSEETVGREYSDLMVSHFGLENEYSIIADRLTEEIDALLETYGDNPSVLKNELQSWQHKNGKYLSPILQVKLEYIIAQQDAKLTVAK